jgi:hypothetical protein
MAYFLVQYEGSVYANDELYYTAIAGGERSFMRMLAGGAVAGKMVLDQVLYPVNGPQQKICEGYNPVRQDFDDAVKHFRALSGEELEKAPGRAVCSIDRSAVSGLFKYRDIAFFRVSDYKESGKYRMLAKTAAVKLCGKCYIAVNAADTRIEAPIIAAMKI